MFWSNLFKKKAKSTIISNTNYSDIPSFDDLSNEEKEYVDKLKEEYIKFYDAINNFTDLDYDLFTNIKMNQDLALDIMHKDHLGNILDSLIDSKKLVYYAHKIKEENSALKYKYIALKELRKNKKNLAKYMSLYILGKKKINILKAIDHQMNIIYNLLVVTNSNIYNYNACAMASYPNINNQNVDEELDIRYKDVSKDYNDLFCKTLNINKELLVSDKITYAELLIDKFVYENKDLIDKLKEQLDLIADSEIKDDKEHSKIINNLMKIKMYYNIFNKYGRFKVTKEDFTDLYQIIFNVYTYFIFKSDFISYYQTLNEGNEKIFYTSIVNSKVELFKMKKSPIFNANYLYSNDVYKCLTQILENSSVILNDEFNFSLLLSLDYEKGINNFFDFRVKNKIPNIFSDSNKYLRNEDYYKLVIGVYKYVEINKIKLIKIKYNKEDSKSYFLDKYLTDKEIISYLVKKYEESKSKFELYELVNNINFNEFPKGIPSFCLDSIIKYYNFNDRKPLIISDNYIDLYIKYYQARVKNFIFNGSISNFHIILDQDFEKSNMNTKFIIPIKTRKIIFESDTRIVSKNIPYLFDNPFYNINEMLSKKSYFLNGTKNWRFSKLGSMIVLKKDLLEYRGDRLFTHLITLFIDLEKSFIAAYKLDRNVKDSTTIRLFHEYMVNTWRDFFENITFIDDNGNIFKTNYFNYSDNNYNDILSIIEDTYYYAIRFYVKSIKTQFFLDNYYEKANKKPVKYLKLY